MIPPPLSRGQAGAAHLHFLNTKKEKGARGPSRRSAHSFLRTASTKSSGAPDGRRHIDGRCTRGDNSKRGEADEGGLFRQSYRDSSCKLVPYG